MMRDLTYYMLALDVGGKRVTEIPYRKKIFSDADLRTDKLKDGLGRIDNGREGRRKRHRQKDLHSVKEVAVTIVYMGVKKTQACS